jgi:hypothetical protein
MMGASTHPPDCGVVRDDLAALATGTLTGRRRAEVLDHLEHCPSCAVELEQLSATVDALMTLIPEATPPEGFAERVTDRWDAEPRRAVSANRQPMRRRVLAAAAVVAVAVGAGVGFGAALFSSGSGPGAGGAGVHAAALGSVSGAQGTVILLPGQHGWLVMSIDDVTATGLVTCSVGLADGSRRVVGRFPVTAGYGSWAVRLPVASSSVRSVEVRAADGKMVASARISA